MVGSAPATGSRSQASSRVSRAPPSSATSPGSTRTCSPTTRSARTSTTTSAAASTRPTLGRRITSWVDSGECSCSSPCFCIGWRARWRGWWEGLLRVGAEAQIGRTSLRGGPPPSVRCCFGEGGYAPPLLLHRCRFFLARWCAFSELTTVLRSNGEFQITRNTDTNLHVTNGQLYITPTLVSDEIDGGYPAILDGGSFDLGDQCSTDNAVRAPSPSYISSAADGGDG